MAKHILVYDTYVESQGMDENEQYLTLCELLDGTIGLSDAELKRVCL